MKKVFIIIISLILFDILANNISYSYCQTPTTTQSITTESIDGWRDRYIFLVDTTVSMKPFIMGQGATRYVFPKPKFPIQ